MYFQKTKSTVGSFAFEGRFPAASRLLLTAAWQEKVIRKERQSPQLPGSHGLLFSAGAAEQLRADGGTGGEAGERKRKGEALAWEMVLPGGSRSSKAWNQIPEKQLWLLGKPARPC